MQEVCNCKLTHLDKSVYENIQSYKRSVTPSILQTQNTLRNPEFTKTTTHTVGESIMFKQNENFKKHSKSKSLLKGEKPEQTNTSRQKGSYSEFILRLLKLDYVSILCLIAKQTSQNSIILCY